MTRFERQQFFVRILTLREQYLGAGEDDRRTVLSVDDVIAYAVRLLEDSVLLASVVHDDPTSAGVEDQSSR